MSNAPENLAWQRSSYCVEGGCAEVATDGEAIYIRSSREPHDVVTLDLGEWAALKAGIIDGEF